MVGLVETTDETFRDPPAGERREVARRNERENLPAGWSDASVPT